MGLTGKDTLNLLFMITAASLLTWGTMMSDIGGPGSTFSFHPFCMGLAFTFFIQIGFWMFNYEDLPGEWIDSRQSRRKAHAFFQITGMLFVVMGYFAVVKAHNETPGAALFKVSPATVPWGFTGGLNMMRLAHIIVGYICMGLLACQFVMGVLKYRVLVDEEEKNDEAYWLHEYCGNMVYSTGLLNVLTGVWLWNAWSLALRCAITLTLLTSMTFGPRWDGTRGFLHAAEDDEPQHAAGAEPEAIGAGAI